jgi:hypothetical protein
MVNRMSKSNLDNMIIGCSFSPEMFRQEKEALDALKLVVNEFHIKDIRLGIRWNRAVDSAGKAHVGYYRRFIDYCIREKANICLNVGPIKTFRWPEQHVPQFVTENIENIAPKSGIISLQDEIAQEALDYLNDLLEILKREYGKNKKTFSAIQPENEPFVKFGTYRWTMSDEYLKNVLKLIRGYFPEPDILLNSGEYGM